MLIYKIHAIFCLPSIVLAYHLLCPDRSQMQLRSQGLCTKQNDTKTLYTCLEDLNKDTYNESCSEKEDAVRPGRRFVYVGLATDMECSAKRYQPIPFYKSSGAMCLFLKSTCNEVGQMVARKIKGSSLSDTTCICDYTEGYAYVTRPSDPCKCVPSEEDCSCYEKLCPENQLLSADYECIHRNAPNVTTCDTIYKSETNITTTTSTTVRTDSTAFNESPTRVKYAVDAAVSITVMIFFILLEAIFLGCIITMRMGAQNGQHIIEHLPELPAAFQKFSDKDKEHYLRIIKSGTETRYYIRIVIIGENGVGKTCLLRRLLGESIEGVTSTDGVDVDNKFKIRLSDGQWIIDKVTNNIMTRMKSIETRLEQLVTEKYEIMVNCRIWDFTGSRLFYPTHQIFLRPNAVHLLVADIMKDVNQMNTEGGYDNIDDYIHFWFNSINSYSKYTKDSTGEHLNPPVIVVCTGIDHCGDKLVERKIEFEKQLKTVLGNERKKTNLRRTCYVSNIEPSDEDFDCLRQSIFEFGKNIETFGARLPIRWIHLEQALDSVREDGIDIFDWSGMVKLASIFSIENQNEVSLFLKYHHKIGNIIYFETLNYHIILNPKWLADALKCFISDKYGDDLKLTPEWKTLEETGELKPWLILKLLQKEPERNFVHHKDYLLEVMEAFGMIAKISVVFTKDGQKQVEHTYYMPCMVNKKISMDEIVDVFGKNKDEYTSTPWLCIQFDFMPFDFMNHILCHYIKQYSLCTESSSGQVALYHGMGVFYLDNTKSNKFILCFFKNTIAMQIWQFTKLEKGKCRSMLEELMSVINTVKDKYEPRRIYYTVKVKCADGDIHIAAGRKSYIELTDVSKKYFCEEHHARHDTSDFLQTWFEKNSENMAIEMTEELEDNFFRIIKLVYGVAPQAVRKMFDKYFPPISLAKILKQNENKLNVLVKRKWLTTTQMKLLFPETGFTSSSNFDVILMICLLRNLSTIPHPVTGFDVLPHSTDTSEGADLARVKYYRHKIASSAVDRLTKSEFTAVWKDLEQALLRLGGSEAKAMCDVIKNKTF